MIDGNLGTHFQTNLPRWDWQRIENSGVGRGCPDLNGCYRGVEVWIENKRTEGWAVDVEPWQIAWAERRTRAGGRVFLAVRRYCKAGPRRPACDDLYLYRTEQARAVRMLGLKGVKPLGHWSGQPASWNWAEIEACLLGGLPLD